MQTADETPSMQLREDQAALFRRIGTTAASSGRPESSWIKRLVFQLLAGVAFGLAGIGLIIFVFVAWWVIEDWGREERNAKVLRYKVAPEVQTQLFGRPIAGDGALIDMRVDPTIHWNGEGFVRWRYRIASPTPELLKLCEGQSWDRCTFHRSIRLADDDLRYADYQNGVLTLSVVWS
ncbi:MAG: hypothetical protein AB7O49_05335 [Sphingomonadales bacterium]